MNNIAQQISTLAKHVNRLEDRAAEHDRMVALLYVNYGPDGHKAALLSRSDQATLTGGEAMARVFSVLQDRIVALEADLEDLHARNADGPT